MDNTDLQNENNNPPTKEKSVKKNYIFNLVYQMFALLTPLIVTPYISRVLGSAGVGQYSFTYSIVTYFVLFGALGFGYYSQREIARHKDSKEEQSKIFYEIFIARFISVGISLLVYIGIILTGVYGETYTKLMWILSITVVATIFNVDFLYQGNEEFGIIALLSIISKVLGVVSIIVFVKNESHVWLYTLLQSVIVFGSYLFFWFRLPKMLVRVPIKDLNIKRHFLPSLLLFIPTIAVSVYTVLDKTLIGVLVPGKTVVDGVEKNISDMENGYYDNAEKIVKMSMMVVTSLGTVMIPRNSNAIAKGDYETFNSNINAALKFVFFLGIPIMFGVAATTFNISPWFFGDGYEKVPYLMAIMSPLVFIIGLSNILGLQYLLPLKKDRKYTIAITSGAFFNLVLNIPLIHFLWSYGAAIATVAAELLVTVIMLFFVRKDIHFGKVVISSWKYIVAGLIMFGSVFTTQYFLPPSILYSVLLIVEGILVYFIVLLVLRDSWLLAQINNIKAKLVKKKQQE